MNINLGEERDHLQDLCEARDLAVENQEYKKAMLIITKLNNLIFPQNASNIAKGRAI